MSVEADHMTTVIVDPEQFLLIKRIIFYTCTDLRRVLDGRKPAAKEISPVRLPSLMVVFKHDLIAQS